MKNNHYHVYQKLLILSSILLMIFPLAMNGGVIEDLKIKIQKQQDLTRELEKQAAQYQETIKQKRNEMADLKSRIILFEAEIAKLGLDIQITQSKIDEKSFKIAELEIQIRSWEEEIEKQKIRLAEIIRNIHDYDETDLIELILKARDFSEIFNQAGYMEMLQGEIQEMVLKIKELKANLEIERAEALKVKAELGGLRDDLNAKKEVQEKQKGDKEWLLAQTKKSESRYQRLLSETEEKQKQVEQAIYELEERLRIELDRSKVPSARSGVLSWPTEGLLTQGYGCLESSFARRIYPSCNNGRGGFHNGVDVAAASGTKIFAAREGKVIASGEAPYAYGNWIAVEHDNGLITLYTHMSLKKVQIGDIVEREKTMIGYMGSSGLSTGSHLHFTVYAPGTFQTKPSALSGILPIGATLNPMDYL